MADAPPLAAIRKMICFTEAFRSGKVSSRANRTFGKRWMAPKPDAPEKGNTMTKKIKPSELEAESQRLIREGKMPTLEKLLQVIDEARAEYRDRILAARREEPNGTDAEN
jgi:hypothetical protein